MDIRLQKVGSTHELGFPEVNCWLVVCLPTHFVAGQDNDPNCQKSNLETGALCMTLSQENATAFHLADCVLATFDQRYVVSLLSMRFKIQMNSLPVSIDIEKH